MRNDREQATVLRKSGMSYSDIVAKMAVPRSTLSSWFKNLEWSKELATKAAERSQRGGAMRLMVLNTVRGNRLRKVYEEADQDALVDFDELKYHPLFIAGVMAYWAHGDKTSKHVVSISNQDPRLLKIWLSFLRNICGIQDIRPSLFLKSGQNIEVCQQYWSKMAGFDVSKFGKSTIISGKATKKRFGKAESHGICKLNVNSAYLKHKILKWVELQAGIV